MLEDFRLKVFMAVADEGSFTRAAKALGISQPAVSQHIAELEKGAGTILFSRTRGAVTLTDAGLAFKEYASKILYWYSAAGDMFGPAGKLTSSQPIRISSDILCAESVLPGLLVKLRAASPGLSFKVSTDLSQDFDVCIRSRRHIQEMSLEDNLTFAGSITAAAVASNPGYSSIGDLRDLPAGTSLAVWSPYSEILPPDFLGRVSFEAPSPAAVAAFVRKSPSTVGLVPRIAVPEGMASLPVALPSLLFDLHLSSSGTSSDGPMLHLMGKLLGDSEPFL